MPQGSLEPTKPRYSYAFDCEIRCRSLRDEIAKLKDKTEQLRRRVVDASRNGEQVYQDVTRWLISADKAIGEAEELVQLENEAMRQNCFLGFCPDLKSRRRLSKKTLEKTSEIAQLCSEEQASVISFCPQVSEPNMYNGKLLHSRVLVLNRIVDALRDPGLNVIGVYGAGGVGKTTLVRKVCALAREEELFDDVIMVFVSQFPDLRRIQAQIAGSLGLDFDAEDVTRRASQLCQRLKEGKSLVVLDDVWQKLDFLAVGIPLGDEFKGCKLLVSSRRKDVLSSEMGSQKDFLLDVLKEEDSWSLFQTIVPKVRDPKLNTLAVEIAKKCAGLPLLIVMVFVQLKYKSVDKWFDMLEKLSMVRNEDLPERVHGVVESSFENLPGEQLKSLFLLCASFAESNIQIQYLLIRGMGLCLFGRITTIEEARRRLFRLINLLKGNYLLLDGDLDGHVKLHDVVRDAAISIASRFQNWFVGAGETRLRDWPNRDCTRITLQVCSIQDLPASLKCPKANLFLLSSEDLYLEIPDLFFEGLAEVKVVSFTGIYFGTRLRSSLGCLINLVSLCLHRCRLGNMSVIGELTELEFLSFADSDFVELPREIEALTQLKLLDMTNCSKLQVIPTNVISKLLMLEELYMCNTCVQWDVEGNASLVELEKLSNLSSFEIQVVNLKFVPKFSSFSNGLRRYKIIIGEEHGWENFETSRMIKLTKTASNDHLVDAIKLLLRRTEDLYLDEASGIRSVLNYLMAVGFPELRHLCIKNDHGIQHLFELIECSSYSVFPVLESLCLDSLTNLKILCDGPLAMGSFGELQLLKVSGCGKLKSLFSLSNFKFLGKLQRIEVESCKNMEAIVSEASGIIECTQLKSLKLKNLPHFKGFGIDKKRTEKVELLFNEMTTFLNLMSLEVKKCKSLKRILTISNIKSLLQLKRLVINDCEFVEEILWRKESEDIEEEGTDKIVLPKLTYVSLKKLKNLKRFSCGFPVEFSSLTELSIYKCPAMEYFASRTLEKNTSFEEHLFGESVILYNLDRKWFPRLTRLHLQNGCDVQYTVDLNDLNSLESFYFDGRCLNARNCNKLKNLFSFPSSKFSTQLVEMDIQSCHKVEAIVGGTSEDVILEFTQLRSLKLENLPHLLGFCEPKEGIGQTGLLFNRMVSFPNLTSLVVQKCNSLKYVFSSSMVKCLVQLRKLEISNCELVEAIIQRKFEEIEEEITNKIVFPKLGCLSLCGLPNVKMFGCGYEIEFPLLRELSIECPAMENFMCQFSDRNNNYNGAEYLFNELATFPNLENMILRNMDKIRYLWDGQFILDDLFSELKSLNIANCSRLSVVFPTNTFRRFQKLEMLHLSGCCGIEEIFQFEETEFGEIHKAEEFALGDLLIVNLASLNYVFPSAVAYSFLKLEHLEIQKCNVQVIIEETHDTTRFMDTSLLQEKMLHEAELYSNKEAIEFPRLCSFKLKNLPHLSGFCNKQEQGFGMKVSFPSLKDFQLCHCKNFKYVFTTTMVNSFMELEKLEINNCELVEEILLSKKFDEVDDVEIIEKIVFPKLEYLSLEKLPNLKVFDFGYPVEFQSLKELSISYCPVLKNFVSKNPGKESDEYLFNEMVSFSNLERMKVCHTYSFSYLWDGKFTAADSFLKLKSLRIEYCLKISVVFPSNIYRRFQGLETLYLCCCSRVEEIYQFEEKNFDEIKPVGAFSLQDLEIRNLPSLKYIWSEDPPGASTFEYLRFVKVFSCKDLISVFPKSVACRLLQLQHLKISNSGMEFIISNTNVEESNFMLPQLTVLQLENAFQMSLFEGPCTSNQAMNFRSEIRSLQLCGSDQMTKLGSNTSAYLEEKFRSFVTKEFICNLEELTLDDQGLKLILCFDLGVEFSKLKQVTLRSIEEDSIPLLFDFLRRCALKKLVFVDSYLEEIFLLEDGLLRIECLEVVGDDNMKHILKNDFRFNPILENLLTLEVEFCEYLISIAPSSASFRNLTSLNVSVCFKMTNLVTASTARTMTNLIELRVSECYMMEDIVKNDEMHDFGINFNNLKCLELCDLPKLNSFCSNSNSSFPLLEQMVVKKCFTMKKFCSGKVSTPKLKAIHFDDEKHWEGDLNATIASQLNSRVPNMNGNGRKP